MDPGRMAPGPVGGGARMNPRKRLLALGALAVFVVGACSSGTPTAAPLTTVKLQLQWVTQAQFAGYYAALDQGYYKDAGLDVQILIGGPQVNNVQVVASGGADIGVAWLPNLLRSREPASGTAGTD